MSSNSNDELFELLGQEIERQREPADSSRQQAQQALVLSRLSARQRSGWTPLRWGLAIAGVAAVLLALWLWIPWKPTAQHEQPLFSARDGLPVAEGRWLDTSAGHSKELVFRDGSELATEGAAQIKILRSKRGKVEVRIRRGKVRSAVRSRRYRWTFAAGPYQTHVLGTALSLDWKPTTEHFVVEVTRGQVRVEGGRIGEQGVTVEAGRRLTVRDGRVTVAELRPTPTRDPDASVDMRLERQTADAGQKKVPKRRTLSRKWHALALRGQRKAALAEAKRQGFSLLLRRLGARDLLLLADVARLAGDPQRARRALLTCRQRFTRSAPAQQAAFRLGRMALEVRRAPREAAKWFRTFLRESPRSPLRPDATGRLMLALWRSGQRKAAARVARTYLSRYPGGGYAEAATRCQAGKSP